MVGAGAAPMWLQRALYAADAPSPRKKILVAIFQRGAADGLNIVVPHGEKAYYDLRPTIAIPRPSAASEKREDAAIDLDGFFGLHPSLAPLKPLFDQGHLAIVDAVGSPDPTRSHFDAQDYMESGTPGLKATASGWMNRALPPAVASLRRCAPWRWDRWCRARWRAGSPPSRMQNIAGFQVRDAGRPSEFERCTRHRRTRCWAARGARHSKPWRMLQSIQKQPYTPAARRRHTRAAASATACARSRN